MRLAKQVGRAGGTYPAVFNAANEQAVDAFHEGRLTFLGIIDVIERVVDAHDAPDALTRAALADAEEWARRAADKAIAAARSLDPGSAGRIARRRLTRSRAQRCVSGRVRRSRGERGRAPQAARGTDRVGAGSDAGVSCSGYGTGQCGSGTGQPASRRARRASSRAEYGVRTPRMSR